MDSRDIDKVSAVLGVEVVQVVDVLEVVRVDVAVLGRGVRGDIVVDDLDIEPQDTAAGMRSAAARMSARIFFMI